MRLRVGLRRVLREVANGIGTEQWDRIDTLRQRGLVEQGDPIITATGARKTYVITDRGRFVLSTFPPLAPDPPMRVGGQDWRFPADVVTIPRTLTPHFRPVDPDRFPITAAWLDLLPDS